jgi:mRNA interferase MazF
VKRGDIVTVAVNGDYRKPRPAVIIQSDIVDDTESVIICLCTSDIASQVRLRRILLHPTPENGLKFDTQIMTEKIITIPRARVADVIGSVSAPDLLRLNGLLIIILGLDAES